LEVALGQEPDRLDLLARLQAAADDGGAVGVADLPVQRFRGHTIDGDHGREAARRVLHKV
jgi:hypothetical protein